MIYNDKIISFFNTPFPVGMSLVITKYHCLSSKIGTILDTICSLQYVVICKSTEFIFVIKIKSPQTLNEIEDYYPKTFNRATLFIS